MTEEDSRKGSGGKRKRVTADDGEDEKRKTRSTAEPDWVGRVMDGINGVLRTMEENEKRAQSFRRGLESRLQVMEGNMVELGRMVKVGVNTIMADQYEMRMAIERDDEGTKKGDEVTEDEDEGSDEGDKETKEDEKDEEMVENDEEKDGEGDEAKGDGEDEAEVTAEVTAETGVEAVAEATAETTSEAAPSSPA